MCKVLTGSRCPSTYIIRWAIGPVPSGLSSVQFSRSVVSDSLQPHESQHARPPCPSPTPGVHPDSRPSSQWCHPAISPSVVPFSSCPQSLPASESFPMSQLFAWGGQSTSVSALEISKYCRNAINSEININIANVWKLKNSLKTHNIDILTGSPSNSV